MLNFQPLSALNTLIKAGSFILCCVLVSGFIQAEEALPAFPSLPTESATFPVQSLPKPVWVEETRSVMGTEARLRFLLPAGAKQNIQEKVFAEFERFNQLWSPYIASSELSRFNDALQGHPFVVSEETFELVQLARRYSDLSSGAFDITVYSLSQHIDYRKKQRPDKATHQQALASIDYRALKAVRKEDGPELMKAAPLKIDPGGIAKGYAVDRAIALLKAEGVTEALVNLGGDSRVLGSNGGKGYWVGIKKPRGTGVALRFPVENTAFSTSGDYERYFIEPETGTHYHHILVPSSGDSARNVTSATVLGPLSAETDALSTTIFVLGLKKGLSLIESLEGFDAILIDAYGKVHYSRGLSPAS